MNILVIIGNYHPFPSSVANCVKPLLVSLNRIGHNISIISNTPGKTVVNDSFSNGLTYIGIPDKYTYFITKINSFFPSKPNNRFLRTVKFAIKLPFHIRYRFFYKEKNMGGWSVHRSTNQSIVLDDQTKFDLVVSFSQPFTAHLIAYKFVSKINRRIPWLLCQYDPYSKNMLLASNSLQHRKLNHQEQMCFNLADRILATPELIEFYMTTDFSKYNQKFAQLNYSLYKTQSMNIEQSSTMNDRTTLIFAGRFYDTIRNPLYMMKMLNDISLNMRVLLLTDYHEEEFIQYIIEKPETFQQKSRVSQDAAINELQKADFLISVGNTVKMQIPAKIFEYMGLGMPIIHFSKSSDDPALKYLSRYPMVLIINEYEDDYMGHIKKLEHFIEKRKGERMSYEEVVKYLPEQDIETIAKKFLSIVDSI